MANNDDNNPEDQEVGDVPPTIPAENSEVASLAKEVEKWKTDFLYLRAELDNIKKNHIKERSDLIRFGSERIRY